MYIDRFILEIVYKVCFYSHIGHISHTTYQAVAQKASDDTLWHQLSKPNVLVVTHFYSYLINSYLNNTISEGPDLVLAFSSSLFKTSRSLFGILELRKIVTEQLRGLFGTTLNRENDSNRGNFPQEKCLDFEFKKDCLKEAGLT